MVSCIASRTQLDSQLAQPQCPEISGGPEQGVRFTADFLEIVAVDETTDLADALCSANEEYVEELAQCLAGHDLCDHFEAIRVDRREQQAINRNRGRQNLSLGWRFDVWPAGSPNEACGHLVELGEEGYVVERL